MKITRTRPAKPAKVAKPPRRVRQTPFPVGPAGKTANDRYREALEEAIVEGRLSSEAALARRCDELLEVVEHERPRTNQPLLNAWRNDQSDIGASKLITVVARALGVEAMWLQHGLGPKHPQPEIAELAAALEARGLKVRKQ